jgi:glycerol-3-phosphate acyltransferase PlsX
MDERGEITFTGSCEAREIPFGTCDIAVCDGFTGNIVIKMYEGTGQMLLSEMKKAFLSDMRSKLGALMIKNSLKTTLARFDTEQYGGAPVLGLKSLVVKMHGSARAGEVKRAIEQCVEFYHEEIAAKITAYIENNRL